MTRHTKTLVLLIAIIACSPALAQDAPKPDKAKPQPGVPAVSPDDVKKAQEQFEAGRKLFFQGHYKAAVAKLAEAVKTNAAKTTYKLLLAKAHRYSGSNGEAIKLLTAILKENPEHAEAGLALAELFDPIKDPDKVINTLEPLLKFKHDYPMYHLLAEAYYEKDDLEKARKYFEQATRLNPRAGGDYYRLGNIYMSQSRFARAAIAYERAGELGIDSDVYHFKLASVYFNMRNYLGRVTTAKIIGGKPGQIRDNLLIVDAVPGKKDIFYVSGPKSAAYQVVLAQDMGVKIAAIKLLEANTWLSARRYAKADALYKSLEGKLDKADHGLFWFYWAQTALGLDQFDTYIERINNAIKAEPDVYKPTLGDAYVTVANRYHQRGERKKHIEFLNKALQINPLSASLHLTLGDAHWQQGDRERAIQQYKLVLELEPNHAQRVRLLNRIRGEEDSPQTPATIRQAGAQ